MSETTARRFERRALEHVLHHRRGLRQDADARRDIDEEDAPQQIELRRADRVVAADTALRDHRVRLRGRRPSRGLPSWRRRRHQARPAQHHREIHDAERHDRRRHAEPIHEEDVQVAGDERAAAEAHDRHPGCHAAPIGKPLHEHAHRRDVAEPAADAADDSHPEKDEERLSHRQADAAHDEARTEEQRRCRCRRPRTAPFDPRSGERGAETEQRERGGERDVGRAEPPWRIGKQRLDGSVERAPRVDRSDADVNENGADGNPPAARLHDADYRRFSMAAPPA